MGQWLGHVHELVQVLHSQYIVLFTHQEVEQGPWSKPVCAAIETVSGCGYVILINNKWKYNGCIGFNKVGVAIKLPNYLNKKPVDGLLRNGFSKRQQHST